MDKYEVIFQEVSYKKVIVNAPSRGKAVEQAQKHLDNAVIIPTQPYEEPVEINKLEQ